MEDHTKRNEKGRDRQDLQRVGRIARNLGLFILRYYIETSFKMKIPLIISIDYTKAHDSTERSGLTQTLIKDKFSPKVIDIIAKLYEGDTTKIRVRKGRVKYRWN